ncbi:hypothetical protein ACIPY5_12090 [Microbacterium sp. NPDC089698]|uniref:phage tail tube protein n=1 Tax=Microbacterium sp. NPDC089698 TaxID=3364200 RepID=UPI003825B0F7
MAGPTGAVNSANIFTGGPDQAVTGAVLSAPIGTTLPTSISGTLPAAFAASGYVSDKGLSLTPNRATKDIKDWSNTVIRKVLDSFDNELEWENLETNEASLKTYWGDANVTVTAATATTGTQTKTAVNSEDLPHKAWAFKIKDGARKVLIVIPDGQVTSQNKIDFVRTDAIKWGVKLTTYPDATGNHIYIYTDDGVFSA